MGFDGPGKGGSVGSRGVVGNAVGMPGVTVGEAVGVCVGGEVPYKC